MVKVRSLFLAIFDVLWFSFSAIRDKKCIEISAVTRGPVIPRAAPHVTDGEAEIANSVQAGESTVAKKIASRSSRSLRASSCDTSSCTHVRRGWRSDVDAGRLAAVHALRALPPLRALRATGAVPGGGL